MLLPLTIKNISVTSLPSYSPAVKMCKELPLTATCALLLLLVSSPVRHVFGGSVSHFYVDFKGKVTSCIQIHEIRSVGPHFQDYKKK